MDDTTRDVLLMIVERLEVIERRAIEEQGVLASLSAALFDLKNKYMDELGSAGVRHYADPTHDPLVVYARIRALLQDPKASGPIQ